MLQFNNFRDVRDYKNDYNRAFGYKQEALSTQIDGAARDLEMCLELLLISSDSDFPLIIDTFANLHSKLQVTRKYLNIDIQSPRPTDYESYEYLPEHPVLPVLTVPCIQSGFDRMRLQDLLDDTLANLKQVSNASSFETLLHDLPTFSYEQLLHGLQSFSSGFHSCYGEYRMRLESLIDWQESLHLVDIQDTVMDVSFELDIDVRTSILFSCHYPI